MKDNTTAPGAEPASTALQSQTNPPDQILVAEDDVFFRRVNTQVLLRSGYEVDAAADGAAAWRALNTERYDLLITDNGMPKVSGIELLKKLHGARMTLPVIMATAALPEEEFTRYPWLQPAATLLKPYTGEEMLRIVKKVLREADRTANGAQPTMDYDMKDNKISQAGEPANAPRQHPTKASHHMAAGRLPTHELARNPSLQLAATLSKPFPVNALLDTVQNVLRATDSPHEQIEPGRAWSNQPSGDGLWL